MRIAIVGSGVSGLVAAHLLRSDHEITVFEASHRIGGHVSTVTVDDDRGSWDIDTGFIVYNEQNYPLFTRLLHELDVESQPSDMSFSVRCERTGMEYNGSTLNQLFVQRRNLLSPSYYGLIRDILRFNRRAPGAIRNGARGSTLGEYLEAGGYGARLAEHYLVPMGSALWSIPRRSVLEMPVEFFVRFFENHGMLSVDGRPEWRVVGGGSARYVEALVRPFRDRIRLRTPVRSVRRETESVFVNGERFDEVVLACHSDEALALLEDPTAAERRILGALPYQENHVVLHTDTGVLPVRKAAWGAWNYQIRGEDDAPVSVTYLMNVLQGLSAERTFCVTLNPGGGIDPGDVIWETTFSHPIYTVEGMAAQQMREDISGLNHTHYCGAYWGYGFHEDGVRSAHAVAAAVGVGV
jgi:predicted NAD/FAD-binding protein